MYFSQIPSKVFIHSSWWPF